MMNLFKWAKVLDKKISTLIVEPNLCTRIISSKSSCQNCVDVCPTKSITFTDHHIKIDNHCVECGLCTMVCPTNSLSSQRPSLEQFMEEITYQAKEHDQVVLHCGRNTPQVSGAVSIPCLGAIPKEAWLKALRMCDRLVIYLPDNDCSHCPIVTGEEVWRNELASAEQMSGKEAVVVSKVMVAEEKREYNESRRHFFYHLFHEMKTVNSLTLKEFSGATNTRSYQEKLTNDSISKAKQEWTSVSNKVVERMTDRSVQPYRAKRKLFLEQLDNHESLREKENIRLPNISSACTFCGACSLLCPTEALTQSIKDNKSTITLSPDQCVDCRLCEDICYFDAVHLEVASNNRLLSGQTVLASS